MEVWRRSCSLAFAVETRAWPKVTLFEQHGEIGGQFNMAS